MIVWYAVRKNSRSERRFVCYPHSKASSILQNQPSTNNEPTPIRTKPQREVVEPVTANRMQQKLFQLAWWLLHDLGTDNVVQAAIQEPKTSAITTSFCLVPLILTYSRLIFK